LNFGRVLRLVGDYLAKSGSDWAIIGGFAMHAHGRSRNTIDLDFLVPAEQQPGLVGFLEGSGYETLHRSAGFSNHLHPNHELGRVDIAYVDEATGKNLFTAAAAREIDGTRFLVPKPEHLIAMKLHALKSDPQRLDRDIADIVDLLRMPGVDRDEVRSYFRRYAMEEKFEELIGRA
jgi:hypothetical protein